LPSNGTTQRVLEYADDGDTIKGLVGVQSLVTQLVMVFDNTMRSDWGYIADSKLLEDQERILQILVNHQKRLSLRN
jgi:hypothetical protein